MRFDLTTFDHPATAYRFEVDTAALSVHERVPGAVTARRPLEVQQVNYLSADATEVRMFILARSRTPDHARPTILTGYEGFNIARTPTYTPAAIAWVEGGGVYALANIRGGSEEGTAWHEASYRADKRNVSTTFTRLPSASPSRGGRSRKALAFKAAPTASCWPEWH